MEPESHDAVAIDATPGAADDEGAGGENHEGVDVVDSGVVGAEVAVDDAVVDHAPGAVGHQDWEAAVHSQQNHFDETCRVDRDGRGCITEQG